MRTETQGSVTNFQVNRLSQFILVTLISLVIMAVSILILTKHDVKREANDLDMASIPLVIDAQIFVSKIRLDEVNATLADINHDTSVYAKYLRLKKEHGPRPEYSQKLFDQLYQQMRKQPWPENPYTYHKALEVKSSYRSAELKDVITLTETVNGRAVGSDLCAYFEWQRSIRDDPHNPKAGCMEISGFQVVWYAL